MELHPAVHLIAGHYNIKVFTSTASLQQEDRYKLGATSDAFGNALDLDRRIVWLWEGEDVVTHLHELAHVITHPPGCHISFVRENFLLMQVERELARSLFSTYWFRKVVRWQQETVIHDDEELFCDERPYWKSRVLWKDGYARARKLGLLDEKNRPTFAMPAWPESPLDWYHEWMKKYDFVHSTLSKKDLASG